MFSWLAREGVIAVLTTKGEAGSIGAIPAANHQKDLMVTRIN
jgi:hypothetical protein